VGPDPPRTMNASVEAKALPTADLELGMYVSKLDRPWIETPFLFQGFHIETPEVIEELRRYCKYVYVDVALSDASLRSEPRGANTPPSSKAPHQGPAHTRSRHAADPPPTEEGPHSDTVVLRAEMAKAHEAHDAAERVVKDLYKNIRAGKDIDLTIVQKTIDPMIDSIMRNDDALSWLVRMKKKDDYIYSHSIASAVWSMVFAKHLGLSAAELQVLATGMVFMDVGKTKIPTELLIKSAALTPAEMAIMKTHVTHGVAIVSRIKSIDPRVIEMVRSHHERYNGTGYPSGLSGGNIPIFARIAGIIDTYDAMTTSRPYAKPRSPYDATRELSKLAGVEFAAEVVEQFIQAIGVFPVGTLVELNTGEVGMVIAQNRVRRLRPKVLLLLDREKQPVNAATVVDLRNQLTDDANRQSLWIERGLAPGDYGLDPTEYYLQDA
jgi:HD-GYP domain-containing protein (c-di-GMP phosphodiesterase class II)